VRSEIGRGGDDGGVVAAEFADARATSGRRGVGAHSVRPMAVERWRRRTRGSMGGESDELLGLTVARR